MHVVVLLTYNNTQFATVNITQSTQMAYLFNYWCISSHTFQVCVCVQHPISQPEVKCCIQLCCLTNNYDNTLCSPTVLFSLSWYIRSFPRIIGRFYQIYVESYLRTLESKSSVWQRQVSGKPTVCKTATTLTAYCVIRGLNWTVKDVKNNRKI